MFNRATLIPASKREIIFVTLFVDGLAKFMSNYNFLPKRAGDFAFSLHKIDFLKNLLLPITAILLVSFLLVIDLTTVLCV